MSIRTNDLIFTASMGQALSVAPSGFKSHSNIIGIYLRATKATDSAFWTQCVLKRIG